MIMELWPIFDHNPMIMARFDAVGPTPT